MWNLDLLSTVYRHSLDAINKEDYTYKFQKQNTPRLLFALVDNPAI